MYRYNVRARQAAAQARNFDVRRCSGISRSWQRLGAADLVTRVIGKREAVSGLAAEGVVLVGVARCDRPRSTIAIYTYKQHKLQRRI